MSCPSSPETPYASSFTMAFSPAHHPNPLQPPKSPLVKAAEAAAIKENTLSLSQLSPPVTPAPLAPVLLPTTRSLSRTPSRSPSPLPDRSPSPGPRALAPPPIEDISWRDGDFELISADNVRFRVHTYHLFSASSVLRSAAEWDDNGRRHIQFEDEQLEAALVIRAFLRVITAGTVATTPDGSGTPSVSALRRLILFLRKWDCPVALQLVLFKVKELLNQGISVPMYTFILGATADDIDTCVLALKHIQQTWNGQGGYTDVRNEGTPGAPTVDPTHLPYTLWSWVPPEYMWALSRAWGRHGKEGTRLPDEFRRILIIIKSGHNRGGSASTC